MKKTILLSSILAAGALFAEDAAPTPTPVASTEVGVMGLAIPSKATLFAVPFLGYTADAITVADMVNTAQLAAGSKLYVPNENGKYDVWTLTGGKWEKTDTNVVIGANGAKTGDGPDAVDVTAARGGAFWLEPAADSEALIYLLGKPASDAGTSTADGGKWNLVGNASADSVNLNTLKVGMRDQIAIQVDGKFRYYMYMDNTYGWCYQQENGVWLQNVDVPVALGQGIWFKPTSNTTINWSDYRVVAQ